MWRIQQGWSIGSRVTNAGDGISISVVQGTRGISGGGEGVSWCRLLQLFELRTADQGRGWAWSLP